MPAPVSIVIPALNAAEELPAALEHLMEGLAAGLIRELVISDGGSSDATRAIAQAAGAEWVSGAPSRGGQLRRGCAAAQGEWLLVLHADTRLEPGWAAAVAQHLQEGQGAPAYFRLRFRARGLMPAWVAGWANLRARLFGLPYGDQGLLIRRAEYEAAGGYPDQPLMEDVALVRRLHRLTVLPCAALTSAARYQRAGWLRRGARNLWTLLRYFLGVKPERLARSYSK
ncbi:TIGR04283 family arsenosugar biosynthesis glycosyltransferase [Leisingera sp. McT4-56]|uniref:TIGR04283 family arsenosugar biosynthesis glycosyltransferase n=1 Tax=Leisingera sp. McT4-56 TaxID=2881255 RepID=UPI001CF8D85B|nr:TIGR04283 family arsenosugar biosynthesis glycosyltransferase [Leisingera sp. McT4-56]MCB4455293.1 TIGR04283 family arsenosugar biosynthesis glycosyltransferase [Leisingera sp. McT4-56]